MQEWLAISCRQSAEEIDRFAIATHRPVLPVEDPAGEEGAPAPERQHVLRQVRVEVGPLAPQLERRRVLHQPPLPLLRLLLCAAAQSAAVPAPAAAIARSGGGGGARVGVGSSAGPLLGVAAGEGCKKNECRAGLDDGMRSRHDIA